MCPWVNIQLAKPGPTIGFLNLVMSDGLGGSRVRDEEAVHSALPLVSSDIRIFRTPVVGSSLASQGHGVSLCVSLENKST